MLARRGPRNRDALATIPGRSGLVVLSTAHFGASSLEPDVVPCGAACVTGFMPAEGGYGAATQIIEKLAVVRPPVQVVLDRLTDVPVDIAPRFVTAEQLLSGTQ